MNIDELIAKLKQEVAADVGFDCLPAIPVEDVILLLQALKPAGKPSWDDAPEWARWLKFEDEKWYFHKLGPSADDVRNPSWEERPSPI